MLSFSNFICYPLLLNSWQLMIDYFSLYVKTLADKLNPDLKVNLNEHSSIWHSIQIWIRLKKLYFHGNHKIIISLTNLFKYLLSEEILSEWKIEFILPYLVRNSQINAWNKLTAKWPSKNSPIVQGLILNMVVKPM